MEARQVFSTYDRIAAGGRTAGFCPSCGTRCGTQVKQGVERTVCPDCGHVRYENPSPAVSILVADGSRFVLCRRAAGHFESGKWCLPCGFIEFGEDYLSAAVREVKEETDLDVRIASIISVVSNFFRSDLHTLVIVLLAHVTGGALGPRDGENDAVKWFTVDAGLPKMAFEADTHIIQRYFETRLAGAPVDPGQAVAPKKLK